MRNFFKLLLERYRRNRLKKWMISRTLDISAFSFGFKRKRFLLIFKEPDCMLKRRIMNSAKGKRS